VMKSRRFMCSPQSEDHTLPHRRKCRVVHHSKSGRPLHDRSSPESGSPSVILLRFRHFCSGSLALASLNRACRDHRPPRKAT
jgi:hypothetical protein